MIQHLTEIVDEARKRGKKRLAVAYGQDSHTLEAVYEAYKEGQVILICIFLLRHFPIVCGLQEECW